MIFAQSLSLLLGKKNILHFRSFSTLRSNYTLVIRLMGLRTSLLVVGLLLIFIHCCIELIALIVVCFIMGDPLSSKTHIFLLANPTSFLKSHFIWKQSDPTCYFKSEVYIATPSTLKIKSRDYGCIESWMFQLNVLSKKSLSMINVAYVLCELRKREIHAFCKTRNEHNNLRHKCL